MLSGLDATAKGEITDLITDLKVFCDTTKEILDENVAMNLLNIIQTKSDIPRRKNIALLSANWQLNETTNKYEYRIDDTSITENDYISIDVLDTEKEDLFAEVILDSYDGYYIFTNTELIEEDIELQLVITRTKQEVEA